MEDNKIYQKLIFSVQVGIVGSYARIKITHFQIPTYPAKKPSLRGSGLPVFSPLFMMRAQAAGGTINQVDPSK